MKKPITKLAIASVIIIAAIFVINQLGGSIDGSSIAWADVIKKMEQVTSAVWKENRVIKSDGKEIPFLNHRAVRYFSSEYGGREDMYNEQAVLLSSVFWLTQDDIYVRIVPLLKQYERTKLSQTQRKAWMQSSMQAIIDMLKLENPKRLGRKNINGREVEGFEIRDSEKIAALAPVEVESLVVRAWIDVETSLPVRTEAQAISKDKYAMLLTKGKPVEIKVVADEYQWNAYLDPDVFEPNIPDDYTLIE